MSLLVRIRRLRPHLSRARLRRSALLASGLSVLVLVELGGRRLARTDVHDLTAVPLLLVAAVLVGLAHRERELAVVRWGWTKLRAARGWVAGQDFEVGVDLRGRPALSPGIPRIYRRVAGALLLLPFVTLGVDLFLPGGDRALGHVSYVVHVVWLALRWAAVVVVGFGTGFLAAAVIHDWFVHHHRGRGRRRIRAEILAMAGTVLLVAAGVAFLPGWVPYALVGVTTLGLVGRIWWPTVPEIQFAWREGAAGSPVRGMSSRVVETFWAIVLVVGFVSLLLLVHGASDLGLRAADAALPVTGWLRRITAWVGSASIALALAILHVLFTGLRRPNLSRPTPLSLRLGGHGDDRRGVAALARELGWRVRSGGATSDPLDVPVDAVPSPMPPVGRPPRWPIEISARGLEVPELQTLIHDRDVAQRRRAIRRGLIRLLGIASRRTYRRGSGFWIAPHQWFVAGLGRDEDEHAGGTDDPVIVEFIGPPFARIFPHAARSHLFEVLDRVEVDVFFLEDGVGTRRFLAVLDAVYDHHDRVGTRIEERHLTGIQGVRVMVHEFELETPYRQSGYPEPDYEDLGRARIVEIFRDRDEHEEGATTPVDLGSVLLTI